MVRKLLAAAALIVLSASPAAADGFGPAGDAPQPSDSPAQENEDDIRGLLEMCCWARGRAGFNFCEQYAFCVDNPGGVCIGRGPAEGRKLLCEVPPNSERTTNFGSRRSAQAR